MSMAIRFPPRSAKDSPRLLRCSAGALNAESDLKSVTGIYDASLCAKSNETSGKAILARQKEGEISTFHFIDNMTRNSPGWLGFSFSIPAIYDTPRVVRILGEDGTEEMRQVNQPVIEKDEQGNPVERIYDLGLKTYDVGMRCRPVLLDSATGSRCEYAQSCKPLRN